MPELPEVETIARGLARRIVGRVIEWVRLSPLARVYGAAVPLCAALRNHRVRRVRRVGKHIEIDLEPATEAGEAFTLVVHLGMTGRLFVVPATDAIEPHTHLRITFRQRRFELRFCDPRRFGGIWLVPDDRRGAATDWIGRRVPPAGADPLAISLSEWRALLRRRRQIKALLLDQQTIGGIGNIYCDESLHRARLHPQALACNLDASATCRLRRAVRQVLAEAIRAGGSSISDYRRADNSPGGFQRRHRVYGRQGRPCRRCRTRIERIIVAGRGTFLCPRCQRVATHG